MNKLFLIGAILIILGIIGEIRCIHKAATCNWEPIGKAEIVYTVGHLQDLEQLLDILISKINKV